MEPRQTPESWSAWVDYERAQAQKRKRWEEIKRRRAMDDWDALSISDKDTVLREQGEKIVTESEAAKLTNEGKWFGHGKVTCSDNLLWLRNQLKQELEDEISGSSRYAEHSLKFLNLGLPVYTAALQSMAADELNHAGIIKIIIDVITEKCGKGPG